MPKNLKLQCWSCARTYKASIEVIFEQTIYVRCSFCNTEGILDLAPHRDKITVVMRGDKDENIDLPDAISTDQPQ